MSFLDTLNNLTQQLNNAADKITNSGTRPAQTDAVNHGLSGLGVVNENNSNGNIQSPAGFMDKDDSDVRMLATFMNRFEDNSQYVEYLRDWFVKTDLFNVSTDGICIKVQSKLNNITYDVFGCKSQGDVDKVLNNPMSNGDVAVIVGYINFNDNEVRTARQYTVQLIGIEGILEINHAIELADSGLPYVTFDKASFLHMLAGALHDKYKAMGKDVNSTFNNMSGTMSNSLNSFGDRASEALSGFATGVGLSKAMGSESCVHLEKTDEQLADELANTDNVSDEQCDCGVSLNKSSGVSLDKH